jgi:ElaB/YqjD/DUF883 family membrane-anchored ribosome-binding protein
MEQTKSTPMADQLINEIYSLTERYNDNIKNGGKFSDAKEIRKKIKALTEELRKILVQNEK